MSRTLAEVEQIAKMICVIKHALCAWYLGPSAFSIYEISLNFAAPQHNGDRRKLSQQCILSYFEFLCHVCVSYVIKVCYAQCGLGIAAFGSGHVPSTMPFLRSSAFLGTLSDVPRARVMDMVNPVPDAPLAAHHRVPCPIYCGLHVDIPGNTNKN